MIHSAQCTVHSRENSWNNILPLISNIGCMAITWKIVYAVYLLPFINTLIHGPAHTDTHTHTHTRTHTHIHSHITVFTFKYNCDPKSKSNHKPNLLLCSCDFIFGCHSKTMPLTFKPDIPQQLQCPKVPYDAFASFFSQKTLIR